MAEGEPPAANGTWIFTGRSGITKPTNPPPMLMENRHGLLVDTMVTFADGTAERDAAVLMASQISGVKQVTLGGDKNYDTQELVRDL